MRAINNPILSELLGNKPSGIKLSGTKNTKGFFNVSSFIAQCHSERKVSSIQRNLLTSDEILYNNGYSFCTDGQIVIANKEDYSPIYDGCAVDFRDNKIWSDVKMLNVDPLLFPKKGVAIDLSLLLKHIDAQIERYKALDKFDRKKWRKELDGFLQMYEADGYSFYLPYKRVEFIKRFVKRFKFKKICLSSKNQCIIIVAEGAIALICYYAEKMGETANEYIIECATDAFTFERTTECATDILEF